MRIGTRKIKQVCKPCVPMYACSWEASGPEPLHPDSRDLDARKQAMFPRQWVGFRFEAKRAESWLLDVVCRVALVGMSDYLPDAGQVEQ